MFKSNIKKIYIYQFGMEGDVDREGFLDRQIPVELAQRLSNYQFYAIFQPVVMRVMDDNNIQCRPSSLISAPGLSPIGNEEMSKDFDFKIKGEIIKTELFKITIQILDKLNNEINLEIYEEVFDNFPNILEKIVKNIVSICGNNKIKPIDPNFIYYNYCTFNKLFNARDAYQKLFSWGIIDEKISKEDSLLNVINKFKEVINADNNCIEAYFYLGGLYNELKDFNNSIFYFNKGLKRTKSKIVKAKFNKILNNINDEQKYFGAGADYVRGDNPKKGIKLLTIWHKKQPNDWRALFFRGIGYFKLKNYRNSLIDFAEAAKIKPDQSEIHIEYGICLSAIGDLENAEKHFEEAVRLKPNAPDHLSDLGVIKMRLKKFDEAEDCFKKSLVIEPNNELTLKCKAMLTAEIKSK